MKRFLLVPMVGIIAALGLASAAALTVNGGTVQAGSDVTLTCDTSVDIAYTTTWSTVPTPDAFVITAVTVSDIAVPCIGRALDVVLTQGGLDVGSGTVASITGPSEVVTIALAPEAALVDDVHIAVH